VPHDKAATERLGEFRCAYFARDYEATCAFYGEGLGLETLESWDRGPDNRGTLFRAAAGVIEIMALPGTPEPGAAWDYRAPRGVTLVIEVGDVDAWHRRAVERELEIAEGPVDRPWGHRSVIVRDPGGVTLYLFTAR